MLDLRTEEQLMVAARDGDDEAFHTLALRLRERVARFLRHLGCEEGTVEDLVQETLLRLWASRETYQQRAALMTYVLTIAKNLWLTYGRSQEASGRRDVRCEGSDDLDELLLRRGRRCAGPEIMLLEKYRTFRIRQAIARLPTRQRLVFVLAHIEGLPYAEIAGMIGIAEGTVKSRMYRAVHNLRRELASDCPEYAQQEG